MELVHTLREYPEIAIFLALALGFWFGNIKFGKFSLGVVTSVLLAGVLLASSRSRFLPTLNPLSSSCFFLRSAMESVRSFFAD